MTLERERIALLAVLALAALGGPFLLFAVYCAMLTCWAGGERPGWLRSLPVRILLTRHQLVSAP